VRTFHDILADIDREIATADANPTDTPAADTADLREILAHYIRKLPAPNSFTVENLPTTIHLELKYLTDDPWA
jgi:hypothetical protein